ncbi:MAG TPA: hypothetical protein VM925_21015 [Labilithrix sp.]|nr:hypothetical protein [Labilithrix sp.]
MRFVLFLPVLVPAFLACTTARTTPATNRATTSAAGDGGAPSTASSAPGSGAPLLAPDFGAPGPIRASGYPVRIRTGANDPAHHVGFTADGRFFGFCYTDGGLGGTHCDFADAAGVRRAMSNRTEAETGNLDGPKNREIKAWLAANGVPAVNERGLETTGPALTGTWRYARDIQLHVTSIAGETDKAQNAVRQPALRIGGVVAGYPPVHPYTLTTKQGVGTPAVFYGVVPNGTALSPDGRELGVLAAWHGMEYAGDFATLRVSADAFAARVYNETGLRQHQRGDYAAAQDLFAKATFADPSFDLPPYNLACAHARMADHARAAAALELAIARGGPKVAEKARADHDFDGVRKEPWFTKLVGP